MQVYDAGGYMKLAHTLYHSNEVPLLLRFDSALRGYLFPLLYVPVVAASTDSAFITEEAIIKVLGALLAGFLFGVAIPALWQLATGRRVMPLPKLVFVLAGFLLWRDYFNYTLTDFPAVACLVSGLYLLLLPRTPAWAFLAGVLVAASINFRPVYLVVLPFVALLGTITAVRQTNIWPVAVMQFGLAFGLGFALPCAPQWYINHHKFQKDTPLVIGIDLDDPVMVKNGDLYLQKINDGFSVQKYETSIAVDYTNAAVQYLDPAGLHLLRQDPNQKIDSYGEYVKFMLAHPLDAVALYFRHAFNGIDVLYPTPYLYRVYTSTTVLACINYTLLFGAILFILLQLRQLTLLHCVIIAAVLAPAGVSIPMPVECRYLLTMHLLLLTLACFGWHSVWPKLQGRLPSLAVAYLLFVGICFTLSASTQAALAEAPKLLHP
ncbi:hypothetical protein [Solirubrum puertoriconensis]|nr:hypothetical protein [Solirubrum puertoriconensis]